MTALHSALAGAARFLILRAALAILAVLARIAGVSTRAGRPSGSERCRQERKKRQDEPASINRHRIASPALLGGQQEVSAILKLSGRAYAGCINERKIHAKLCLHRRSCRVGRRERMRTKPRAQTQSTTRPV